MLIKIENGQPTGNPITEDNFRYLFQSQVFPLVLTTLIVQPFGYEMYDFSPRPEFTWRQELVEVSPIKDQFGIWRQTWEVRNLNGAQIEQAKAARINYLINKIDRDVDYLYSMVVGNRETEYLLAESEARAFAAALYQGPVPTTVQDWASIKNWTPQQAADDVLFTANLWRNLQLSIRNNRLTYKNDLQSATSPEEIDSLDSAWNLLVTTTIQDLANQ